MRQSLQISGLFSALLLAGGVHAAGLGKLSVQSFLGQPLRAEIELLAVQKDELQAISARLAGADAFRQARIERTDALGTLRFAVDQRANGQPVIKVTSSAPVNDPFLDMLVEMSWASGRLLREYTILLDPPPELRAQAAAAAQPPVAAPAPAVPATKPAAPVEARPAPAAPSVPNRYGPVKSGETLRGIAAKVKPADASIEQTMVGLFQQNRDAFMGDNMNRLKKGRTLSVPATDSLRALNPAQSSRTVRAHAADWHAYRRQLAEQVAEAPPAAPAEAPGEGKVAPKPAAKPVAPAAPAQDVLKLSKGGPAMASDAKTMEKLNALEEELAAKSRALDEAQQRVSQLESTVRDLQRMMELRTQEAAKPAAPEAVPAEVPAAPPVAETPAQAQAPAPAPVAKVAPAPIPAPEPVDEGSWLRSFITNPLYVGGIIAAILLSALLWMMMVGSRRKQGLTGFEDSIMTGGEFKHESVFKTSGSTAAGAPTEGSMLLTDFSRLGLGAIDTHEVDPIAEAEVYMAYGRDAQAEEILREALGKDPTRHEITLKLLEIYAARKDTVAFETQASELYAALGGQPTPVWQKAAEIGRGIDPDNPLYRVSGDTGTATLAAGAATASAVAKATHEAPSYAPEPMEDMGEHAGSTMGGSLDMGAMEDLELHEVPSYQPVAESADRSGDNLIDFESSAAMATPEPAAESDESWLERNIEAAQEPAPEPASVAEAAPPAEPESESAEETAAEPVEELAPEASVTVGLDWTAELEEAPAEEEERDMGALYSELLGEPEAEPETEEVPEFSLDLPESAELPEPAAEQTLSGVEVAEELPELDLSGIDLDLKEPEAEAAAGPSEPGIDPELWEEVNTKLDLARAYLEMGDKEGAREILQEVMNEGDTNQKGDAGKLIAQCA